MNNTKPCSKCKVELPIGDFYKNTAKGSSHSWCKRCVCKDNSVRDRKKRDLDPDGVRAKDRAVRRAVRAEVLAAYGGACACCGEREPHFLAIDHIMGHGHKHRKVIGARICYWLKRNNYPPGFRVLCHNCNLSRGFYGSCPHEAAAHELPLAVHMDA
jgi:hypothetical protein